ncbi:hypothetical protein [Leptospira sp. GIMC2001]|uniref:hypothetical protein n=1 Tax=Leptospira sp. GIMC2001 TaxID=1513297 RepID=UPI0023496EF3|nr:hypothetical protein [Leptospira sp. GIMC2001]WCL47871.1 hypothetical protein O4O04_11090 [Leptospira sp. GIMC2001]
MIQYRAGIDLIQAYTQGGSLEGILQFISDLPETEIAGKGFLDEVGIMEKYPDDLKGLLEFLAQILKERKYVSNLYNQAMDRYEKLGDLTAHRRPTDDEAKIKQTLTDYILKLEKIFEINDLTDEGIIKELNRFVAEEHLEALTDSELEKLVISNKTTTLLEPHLDKHRETFYGYQKLRDPFQRLIRISDLIIEEVTKKVS